MGFSALSRFGRVLAYLRAMGPTRALPWALAFAVVCTATPASALPILSFTGPSTVTTGQTFTIDVGIGLTDPTEADNVFDLVAFQFGILFDPSLVAALSVTEGTFLSSGVEGRTLFLPGTIDNTTGSIPSSIGVLDAPFPPVSGSGVIFSLQFLALAAGSGQLLINFDDLAGDTLLAENDAGSLIPVDGVTATPFALTIAADEPQPVPEPATLLLLGPGAGLAAARRRRLSRS